MSVDNPKFVPVCLFSYTLLVNHQIKMATGIGKLIVLYGANNTGKSTQCRLLLDKLNSSKNKCVFYKIPQYTVEPAGVMLNEYLRENNPDHLSPREAQILYALDRVQFIPQIQEILANGTNILLEDYWGTGVSWGMALGVPKEFLLRINSSCYKENLAILLDNARYHSGIEHNNLHEQSNEILLQVAQNHHALAEEFGWKIVAANQSIEKVHADIWSEVSKII